MSRAHEPAFPQLDANGNQWWGLTKRELFAKDAPQGVTDPGAVTVGELCSDLGITLTEYKRDGRSCWLRFVARRHVEWADALIAALEAK